MLALGAGLEALQAPGDTEFKALIITGFEVQAVVVRHTTPVATVEAAAADQVEGRGNGLMALVGEYQEHLLAHGPGDLLEEPQR